MEGVEASTENGSQLNNNPYNNYVELNNPDLLQIVEELKEELQNVKIDNERILELNHILLDKIHNRGKDKRNVYETDSETMSYKHKGKKTKYYDSESSSEVTARSHKGKYNYTSDSSEGDCKPGRRKYKPYEEISGEFKKIKPPILNGEIHKGEEAEDWLSRMKKYFHIYNYSHILKPRIPIYNLTEKADIWWQDIKRLKNIKEKYLT